MSHEGWQTESASDQVTLTRKMVERLFAHNGIVVTGVERASLDAALDQIWGEPEPLRSLRDLIGYLEGRQIAPGVVKTLRLFAPT